MGSTLKTMENSSSKLIYDAFGKSRHKALIDKSLAKRFRCSLGIIVLFSVIIACFSKENLIAYFMFLLIYMCWLTYELETISKEINDKIRTDKSLEAYSFDELYYFFGQKNLKIFNKKLYTFNNTEYSQLIYFNYLLSKMEIINFIENLEYFITSNMLKDELVVKFAIF